MNSICTIVIIIKKYFKELIITYVHKCFLKVYLLTYQLFFFKEIFIIMITISVNVQGVKSLGGHFACLCRGFDFYEVFL